MLALRTTDGLDLETFRSVYGVDLPATNREVIDRLQTDGLIQLDSGRLVPTTDGLAIADTLARSFEIPWASPRRYHRPSGGDTVSQVPSKIFVVRPLLVAMLCLVTIPL